MRRSIPAKSIAAAAAALSLLTSSVASAAPISAKTINPLVALSVFGSSTSRAAMCAAGASTVAASAALAAQAQPGCVLPVVDMAPSAVVSEVPPPVMVEPVAVAPAPNVLPLLLALGAFAAAFFLLDDFLLGDEDDDDIDFNVSPA